MLTNHMIASEAARLLSERAGREITLDDLRQMRRHGHIEGVIISTRLVVYTPEQIETATIPSERKSPERKKKKRRSRKKGINPISW